MNPPSISPNAAERGRLGVCSWSLQPASPADLAAKIADCGLDAIQLALDPIRTGDWNEAETLRTLAAADITILSGMMACQGEDYSTLDTIKATGGIRPDATWPANLAAAKANADLAARLGLSLVTLHAGFLPHNADNPERTKMLDRLAQLVEVFAQRTIRLAFETGQETADTLLGVLAKLSATSLSPGVNFDPANMILYNMGDPIAALCTLAPHIAQLHIKDATAATTPGIWGSEVVVGKGGVDWEAFFAAYHDAGLSCDLVIEREAGNSRILDVRTAAARLQSSLDTTS